MSYNKNKRLYPLATTDGALEVQVRALTAANQMGLC